MNIPRARATVVCPNCHEQFIDTDMREWMAAGRTPDEFMDAMQRLTRAHADTCKPKPPPYTPVMRRGRLLWRLGAWFPATWFILLAVAYITGLMGSDLLLDWTLLLGGICLAMTVLREKTSYANGYARGVFAVQHHQPILSSRWLHPGDGVHDPADAPTEPDPETQQ
jgi:hypothetical protein